MYKVAICGKANSGKNTVSHILSDAVRTKMGLPLSADHRDARIWKAQNIAFADPIKEMVKQMFPQIPNKHLYGSSQFRSLPIPGAFKDGKPLTIRQLLIDLGTGVGREYKKNLWLDVFDNTFSKAVKKDKDLVIVTDVRFRNEFDHLKNLGFYQIRLLRDDYLKIDHASETNQDSIKDSEFDYILKNNGTLNDLTKEITKIVPLLKS